MNDLVDGHDAGARVNGGAAPTQATRNTQHGLDSLPFDQFNRHTLVKRAVEALRGEAGRRLRILDVGGYPCWTPRFLPDDEVTVLDVQAGPDVCERFVLGDGARLPFRDGSFDVVVTLDSLEHVERPRRADFIAELIRVARDYVLLTAPFFRPEVRLAEDLLYEFIKATLKARHDQLTEHIEFQLPEVGEVEAILRSLGREHRRLPSGNVYNWLAMMLAKHFVMTIPDSDGLHTALDRFYNAAFFEGDQREPAYRQLFLIAVGGDPAPMDAFVRRHAAPAVEGVEGLRRLELAQLMIKLLDLKLTNHQDARLVEQVEARDLHIKQLLQARDDLRLQLEEARAEIRRRDHDIEVLQAGMAAQQADIEQLRLETRRLRQWLLEARETLAERERQAQRQADELIAQAEGYRVGGAVRERDVAMLNQHIEDIRNGFVMRTMTSLQRKLRRT